MKKAWVKMQVQVYVHGLEDWADGPHAFVQGTKLSECKNEVLISFTGQPSRRAVLVVDAWRVRPMPPGGEPLPAFVKGELVKYLENGTWWEARIIRPLDDGKSYWLTPLASRKKYGNRYSQRIQRVPVNLLIPTQPATNKKLNKKIAV